MRVRLVCLGSCSNVEVDEHATVLDVIQAAGRDPAGMQFRVDGVAADGAAALTDGQTLFASIKVEGGRSTASSR